MSNIEPFGYFKADVCGWTDCHDDDEGAQPLWDSAAMCAIEKQRDELLAVLEAIADNDFGYGPEIGDIRSRFANGRDAMQVIKAARNAIANAKGGAA